MKDEMDIEHYAKEFARLGGKAKSRKKAAASRRNGTLGGRPKHKKKDAKEKESP